MDFHERMAIQHRYHEFWNPLSGAKVDEIIGLLRLGDGARVLDVACGNGEILCRIAERWKAHGIGVDVSPHAVQLARSRVEERGLEGRIEIVEQAGADYVAPEGSFDVTSCFGASWIWGGHAGTIAALANWTRPGGWIVSGEGYWKVTPSPEYLKEAHLQRQVFSTHHGNVELGAKQGVHFMHAIVSSEDDWDRYEGLHRYALELWASENPDHPDFAELMASARDYAGDPYLRWGREELGWAVYLFRKPD